MRSRFNLSMICATAVLIGTGCTHVYKAPLQTVGPYNGAPVGMAVTLRISEELKAAKWEDKMMGDTFVIPLGENLTHNAETMVRAAFSDVAVQTEPYGTMSPTMDASLEPKFVMVEQTMGVMAFSDSVLSVVIEWVMKDPNGNLIWVDSVKGNGTANTGNIFTANSNALKRVERMLNELFLNSYRAILSSQEIQNFLRSVEPRRPET